MSPTRTTAANRLAQSSMRRGGSGWSRPQTRTGVGRRTGSFTGGARTSRTARATNGTGSLRATQRGRGSARSTLSSSFIRPTASRRGQLARSSGRSGNSRRSGSFTRGHGGGSHGYAGGHHNHHRWYGHHGWGLSFYFGVGYYAGFRYYWPYYHYTSGYHYAFFYPYPTTWCYAPYGFYVGAPAYYVTRYPAVGTEYPVQEYETESELPPEPAVTEGEEQKTVEPRPAAGSPTTERFLREGSEAFLKADYFEASKKFRLAAISSPNMAAPLFALSQALIAQEMDDYAARVLREALHVNPELVREPGDIVGVYKSQEEFDRVMRELEGRLAKDPENKDLLFLVGVERYFSGNPLARDSFAQLAKLAPDDKAVARLGQAADERFKSKKLPPIEPAKK